MKLLVISDLHFELSNWSFPDRLPQHDVAILAGDVDVPARNSVRRLARAREYGPLRDSQVVLVPGNHEYYGREMTEELAAAREEAREMGIFLLDKDELVLGDVRILGATLWTDYALDGQDVMKAMRHANAVMNDHRLIAYRGELFMPQEALEIHRDHKAWLEERLSRPHPKTVVVTHHGPSRASVHPQYVDDPLNAAFSSALEELILRHRPDLWVHGHTHSSIDAMVGGTRILCNPKGYGPKVAGGMPENPAFDVNLVVEI